MRDILPDVDRWLAAGRSVAVATVIQTWGSAPRRAGARMALTAQGEIAGSVSGGCVEGAVVEAGLQVLETGRPQLLEFGVADETAWDVGLACGGELSVFVQSLDETLYRRLHGILEQERLAWMGTVVDGPPEQLGRAALIVPEGVDREEDDRILAAVQGSRERVSGDRPAVVSVTGEDSRITPQNLEVFVEVFTPPPRLVMVGGVHIAVALAALARTLGYGTVVVDPRRAFGSEERFPQVDRLIQAYPEAAFDEIGLNTSTAVATLSHDPKIDDPALTRALQSEAFYVGALGSRRTHKERRRRLVDAGLSDEELDRVHSPIGLDLGGQQPAEIALAILAQIESVRHSGE